MKKIEILNEKTICSNPDSPFRYFAWPTVTRLKDGRLAVVASGFRTRHVDPYGKGAILYSADDGESWSVPGVVLDTPLDDRDMGIAAFGKNNERVIITSFNNTVEAQEEYFKWDGDREYRQDGFDGLVRAYLDYLHAQGGATEYLGSLYRISEDGGTTFGKIRKAPVTSPHGPSRTADGGLIYVGVPFLGLVHEKRIAAYRMEPDGDTFEPLGEIDISKMADNTPCEVHTIETEPGKLVVHMRTAQFAVWQSESEDGGKTFTKPHPIMGEREGSPPYLFKAGKTLVCVYGYRQAPYGIRAAFSKDDGKTWDTDYVINDTMYDYDCGYPASVVRKDGTILTVFYGKKEKKYKGEYAEIMQAVWRLPEEYAAE